MNWANSPDVRNQIVQENIRRDEVDDVLRCLHFSNNQEIDNDAYFKVRPIFNILNETGRYFNTAQMYSVDESMIPYFGKHSSKQFIRGKPVRFGFKVRFEL